MSEHAFGIALGNIAPPVLLLSCLAAAAIFAPQQRQRVAALLKSAG